MVTEYKPGLFSTTLTGIPDTYQGLLESDVSQTTRSCFDVSCTLKYFFTSSLLVGILLPGFIAIRITKACEFRTDVDRNGNREARGTDMGLDDKLTS